MATLRSILDERVREGDLYEKLDRNRVRCYACGHCCPIRFAKAVNRHSTSFQVCGVAGFQSRGPAEDRAD